MSSQKNNDQEPSKPKHKPGNKGQRGGRQPGAGRPKGTVSPETLFAQKTKAEYLKRVRKSATKLFNAQMSLAEGVQMLFVIHTDSKGQRRKPELVTDPEVILRFLDENEGHDGVMDNGYSADSKAEDYYFITTKPPDSRTISDMLDRAFGKAPAEIDLTSKGERLTQAPLIVSDIGMLEKKS